MKNLSAIIFPAFLFFSISFAQQSWLEGTWSVRAVEISPEDNETALLEFSNAISFSNFTGEEITFTPPGDEPLVFSVEESGDLFQLTYQGGEGETIDFELLRAFRIDDQLAFFTIISFGGNGTSLNPIYWTDAIAGIMTKGTLPPKPSTSGLAGEYRGFSLNVDVTQDFGVEVGAEILDVSVTATPGGYLADENDGDGSITLTQRSTYLDLTDFSDHNTGSSGDFESLLVFPITDTLLAFLELEGIGDPLGREFMNYLNLEGEAGLLSKDPDYQIPDFIPLDSGNGLPPLLADATPITETPGWLYLDWFKGFKPLPGSNWIYHGRLGWLFFSGGEDNGIFLWDTALSRWMWTTPTAYPWMYAYGSDGGWVFFFEGGSPGSRYFKRGDTGAVVSENDLGL